MVFILVEQYFSIDITKDIIKNTIRVKIMGRFYPIIKGFVGFLFLNIFVLKEYLTKEQFFCQCIIYGWFTYAQFKV